LDSGCTGHYLKVTAPVTNKKLAVTPINVTLPDGASIQLTHTCELLLPKLPVAATKAHIIPGLATSSLLSVGQLVDANCFVKFDRTSVEVLHNHKRILEGIRDKRNGIWTVDLQANNSHKDNNEKVKPHLKSEQAHSVYECTNKRYLVQFLHAAAFSPVQDTWLKAIRAGHCATWPGLTKDLVRKHLPKEIATVKGHLSQRRKNLRSTTTTIATHAPEAIELDDITPEATNVKTHQVFAAMVDVGKVYGDLTGRFPIQSSSGHQYILTLYDYDSNIISTEPMKNRINKEMIWAYTSLHKKLVNAVLKPELQVMDNEFSAAFWKYLADEHIALQLVPPHLHQKNAEERAIHTFKNHFVAGLCSVKK
jgi:hypothetical protein